MTDVHREAMERTIEQARRSRSEDDSPRHPKVGAALLRDGRVIAVVHKGADRVGDHAEFTLLESRLQGEDVTGCTVITTLEPCTKRSENKTPCADRIIGRGIKHVVIGMLDPDPRIVRSGVRRLQDNGIKVTYFPGDLNAQIREINDEFIRLKQESTDPLGLREPAQRRLDDWYHSVNSIYLDKNFHMTLETVFTHLVESAEALRESARGRDSDATACQRLLVKTLAWWFALCGKAGVRSVEDTVWAKFPRVCPYCLQCPHIPEQCKSVGSRNQIPDWSSLAEMAGQVTARPASISAWQAMFSEIYEPLDLEAAVGRLCEEVGELAAGVRLLSVAPGYLLAEVADVFAWLMHVANSVREFWNDLHQQQPWLEISLFSVYPDACSECRRAACACPAILPSAVARISSQSSVVHSELSGRSPLLTPAEMLSQFDIGADEVTFAGTLLRSSDQRTIDDIYSLSDHLLDRLTELEILPADLGKLVNVFQTMQKLAASRRLSQSVFERLLTVCEDLSAQDRTILFHEVEGATYGPWRAVFEDYLAP